MSNSKTKYNCSSCLEELDENDKICPSCGSNKRNIHLSLSGSMKLRDRIDLKKSLKGLKKFLTHIKSGWFESVNTEKYPDGVDITQIIDRENNKYVKRVIDKKIGQVVKDLEEPLDQHK